MGGPLGPIISFFRPPAYFLPLFCNCLNISYESFGEKNHIGCAIFISILKQNNFFFKFYFKNVNQFNSIQSIYFPSLKTSKHSKKYAYVHHKMEEIQLKAKAWKCYTLLQINRSIQNQKSNKPTNKQTNKHNKQKYNKISYHDKKEYSKQWQTKQFSCFPIRAPLRRCACSSACVDKITKISTEFTRKAKILFYIWNERIKYCKRYHFLHYEVNRSVLHVNC